jgi:hypothetical protein
MYTQLQFARELQGLNYCLEYKSLQLFPLVTLVDGASRGTENNSTMIIFNNML